jgi:hypothetical protein
LTQPFLSDTDRSIAMEFCKDRRAPFSPVTQACAIVFSIRIGMIRISFEQHAGV